MKLILFFALTAVGSLGNADSLLNSFPHPMALSVWQDSPDFTDPSIDLQKYPSSKITCDDGNLYPTHPQQTLKKYHVHRWAGYDQNKLKPDETACVRPSSMGTFCVRGDIAYDVILSDTFEDRCGNLYRGFEQVSFLGQDETMGTLVSPGRTIYPKPHSEFIGEFISGGTYAVPIARFMKIGPVLPTDIEQIQKGREQALGVTHSYDTTTHLYSELPDVTTSKTP